MVGKTVTVVKTKVREEMSKKRSGKKKCAEGPNCPYKHEYQHDLEFTHEDEKENKGKMKKSTSDGPSRGAFSGVGQRLGASVGPVNTGSNSSKGKKALKNSITSAASARATISVTSSISNNGAGGCGRNGSGAFRNTSSNCSNSAPSGAICPIINTDLSSKGNYSVNADDQYFRNVSKSSVNGPTDRSNNRMFDITAIRNPDANVVRNPISIYKDDSGMNLSKPSSVTNSQCSSYCLQDDTDKYSDHFNRFEVIQKKNFDWESHKNSNHSDINGENRFSITSGNGRITPKVSYNNNVVINLDSDEDDDIEFVGSTSNTNNKSTGNQESNKKYPTENTNGAYDTYNRGISSSSSSSSGNSRYSSTMGRNASMDHHFDTDSSCHADNQASATYAPVNSNKRSGGGGARPIPSVLSSSSSITGSKRSYHHNDREFNSTHDSLGIAGDRMIDDNSRYSNAANGRRKIDLPVLNSNYDRERSVHHGNNFPERSNCSYSERNKSSFYDEINSSNNYLDPHNQNGIRITPFNNKFDYYASEFNGYSNDSSVSKPMEIDESDISHNQHMNVKCEICGIKVRYRNLVISIYQSVQFLFTHF